MDIVEIFQKEVDNWKGANARISSYSLSHTEFNLELQFSGVKKNLYVVCMDCKYIQGHTSWSNVNLLVTENPNANKNGNNQYTVADEEAQFLVHCGGIQFRHNVEPIYV